MCATSETKRTSTVLLWTNALTRFSYGQKRTIVQVISLLAGIELSGIQTHYTFSMSTPSNIYVDRCCVSLSNEWIPGVRERD